MKKLKFELASQKKVNSKKLKPYIIVLLIVIGHPEALVTDDSRISDFVDINLKKINKRIKKEFGFTIEKTDYLYDIAEAMYDSDEAILNTPT